MTIINYLLTALVNFLDAILPAFSLSSEFLTSLDDAMTVLIDLIQGAGYFLPLDILVICFMTMILVDNFSILARIVQWVVRTVRG